MGEGPAPAPDRRRFVVLAAGALWTVASAGCASVAAVRVPAQSGRLRLDLRDHPGLHGPGGYLKVLPEGRDLPVYVLSDGSGGWAALSPVCTHLGCVVDVQGPRLVCPCHGSMYDRTGRVVRGPAERSLTGFEVREEPPGTLLVDLNRGTGR